ncbi:MAG TPA: hypothetical protein VLZ89_04055 [Anaerolineales bacterium]|nr:hypothetical protein [Anaerolineales bacterium]
MKLFRTIKQRFLLIFGNRGTLIALAVFVLQMLFSLYRFFPTMRDINLWDEAVYINTGRLLANGILPTFAHNPLIGIVYALTYLPFRSSPYWLMQSDALGRLILFALVWWSGYLIAKRFGGIVPALVWVGLLLSTTIVKDILSNPSDSLFAAMSALAFWKLITYYQDRNVRDLGWASGFIGLAALSRNDGLVLFVIFMLIALFFLRAPGNRWKRMLAAVLPFCVLIGGYLLLYRVATGSFLMGTTERSYVAFQQGQLSVYQGDSACKQSDIRCAVLQAESLYGTPQENNNSIVKAIEHNPQAFLARVINTVVTLPKMIYTVYGKTEAYLLFLLGFLGIYELCRQRRFALLGMLLAWTAYLGVYFFTFFKNAYLQTPYFILFMLAAIGVQALIASFADDKRLLIWSAILAVLTAVGIVQSLNYLYFDTLVLLGMIWIGYLIYRQVPNSSYTTLYLVFLAGGLAVGGSFSPPQIQTWGQIPEEHAVLLLQQQLAPDSIVAAAAPGAAFAARMSYFTLENTGQSITTTDALHSKLLELGVKAIYVDDILIEQERYEWNLIEPGIGTDYDQIFSGDNGSVRVLLVKP